MTYRSSLSVLFIAAAVACAPAAGSTKTGIHHDPNLITEAEIASSNETTAYDVINKLRPVFLRTRGRSTVLTEAPDYASVFLDNQLFGDLNSLRNISASTIHDITFYPGTSAATKFGMQYGAGVIAITTR